MTDSTDGEASPISILIVDDHEVVREGLISILRSEPDMVVVGQAESAEEALALLPELDPTVAIVDYRLPNMDGLSLCREIAERRLRVQVVILSVSLEEHVVEGALLAGARAYVVKDLEASELKHAIRAAARGETVIDPKVVGRILRMATRADPTFTGLLRPAHLRVLRLIARGKTNSEISSMLDLTLNTVKSYLQEIYERLGVSNRAQAAAVALRRGLE
jgi:DNA-binding NarL/FixJ family response regulator